MTTLIEGCERTVEQPASLAQVVRPELTVVSDPMMDMLASAVASGNLELVKELYAFKKQVDEDEAKRAYVQAMADFKAEAIVIIKDKENKQYSTQTSKAMYSSLGNLVNTVTPFLSKHGFSADWEIDQTSGIRVVCVMTHRLGYSKRFPITFAPDASGSKNSLQQIKSSVTYGKVVTFESACGLASREGNMDDDGNASGGNSKQMDEQELIQRLEAIAGAQDNAQLQDFYLKSLKAARDLGDKSAEDDLVKAKNKRYRELNGGQR